MATPKRRGNLALVLPLAGAGAIIGHGLGYGAVTPVGHTYMAVVAPLATLLAGGALAVGAVSSLRRSGQHPTLAGLAVAQVVIYTLIEVTEHTLGALDPGGLASPAVLLGLAAQLPVAWLLARLFRLAEVVVARLARRRFRAPVCAASPPPVVSLRPIARLVARPGPPRGPPRIVVV
ncbi:MAG: hypothetical protein RIE08_03845 [Acidimicrobiales bacterium]